MIRASRSIVLSPPVRADWIAPDNPVIGWHNVLTPSMVVADSEDLEHPASNMANGSTFLKWSSLITDLQYVEYNLVPMSDDEPILVDYLALAKHNLGSGHVSVAVEAQIEATWTEIVSQRLLSHDGAVIFRFAPMALSKIRLRLHPLGEVPVPPRIAVAYVGQILVLQRRIYVGHTPIVYGRKTQIANGRSENGNFLGRIVTNESLDTAFTISNMNPLWYRQKLEPCLDVIKEFPFFFSWRPQSYPKEAGYVWLTGDPRPSNSRSNGMMQIQFQVGGIFE